MNILLKAATIIDSSSPHHLQKRDLLIESGKISKIATSIKKENTKVVSIDNLHVSQGWFDPSVSFGEPGYEERETIVNGLKTAANSGFSHIAVNTNVLPVPDTKGGIQFLKSKAAGQPVSLYPIGALSRNGKGVDMAELFDMKNEGAISFYDYKQPINNANLLKIALLYTQGFDGLVQSFPLDSSIAPHGMVNETVNSTKLGLKGIPALAEELRITRDLYLLEYTGGKLHIPTISTEKSVSLIRDAKKKGLQVTCSVAVSNLYLSDNTLHEFDTKYKLMPPLRSQKDCKALLKGLKDGTIDGVTSDHNPIDIEHKKTEFENAAYGSIGLESCFGALRKLVDVEVAVNCLTNLRSTFNIQDHMISEGQKADLTLFTPDTAWTFTEDHILSTSKNAAFLGQKLKGKAIGIVANKKLVIAN